MQLRYRLNFYDVDIKKNIELQFEVETETKAIKHAKKILTKKDFRYPRLYEVEEGEF